MKTKVVAERLLINTIKLLDISTKVHTLILTEHTNILVATDFMIVGNIKVVNVKANRNIFIFKLIQIHICSLLYIR